MSAVVAAVFTKLWFGFLDCSLEICGGGGGSSSHGVHNKVEQTPRTQSLDNNEKYSIVTSVTALIDPLRRPIKAQCYSLMGLPQQQQLMMLIEKIIENA